MLTPLVYIIQRTNGFDFSYIASMGNVILQDVPSLAIVAQELALAYQEEVEFTIPSATPVHLRLVLNGEINTTFEQLAHYPIDDSVLFSKNEENFRKIAEGYTFYCDTLSQKLVWIRP